MERIKSFSEQNRSIISKSEKKQEEFKNLVLNSKNYSHAEKVMVQSDNFEIAIKEVFSAQERFDRNHQKGCGLWSKKYQDMGSIVQGVVNDFSPLIELVRSCAPPYGGMAVGTVSLFFQVASVKNDVEEQLASALSAILNRLPGINLYQTIYIENHELDISLQSKIASAYEEFIDFSIFATVYYKASGPKRWLRAFTTSKKLKTKAEGVRDVIVDIRRLCDELLDKNVDYIKKLNMSITESNMRLEEEVKNLKTKLSDFQKQRDDDRVNEVQQFLNLGSFSEEARLKDLKTYRYGLDNDEEINGALVQQMHGQELESFKHCQDYQRWIRSPSASLLILSGYNNECILDSNKYCWVSPVAINLIEDLLCQTANSDASAGGSNIYAYCVIPSRGGDLYQEILPSILLQLLRKKSHALRDDKEYGELRAELFMLQSPSPSTSSAEKENKDELRASIMQKIALRVIKNLFDESDTVYIIVDRTDRCNVVKNQTDHRKALLQVLVAMVQAARATIRVLAVVDGRSWNVHKYEDELGITMKDRVIFHAREQPLHFE